MCNFLSDLFVYISIFLKLELREITFKLISEALFFRQDVVFIIIRLILKNDYETLSKNAVTMLFINHKVIPNKEKIIKNNYTILQHDTKLIL